MPLDAVCLTAVADELRGRLVGGRVDKIHMPARDDVLFSLRASGGNARLLISASNNMARAHITAAARENPAAPPMFCMLLRKHLSGARLADIEQPQMERTLLFHFDASDEIGVVARKTLAAELMGRHSNVILVGPDGRIVDCIKRVDAEMSERRQVLPGLFYHLPPGQDKRDPLATDEAEWARLLAAKPPEQPLDDWLMKLFSGLSPLVCREIAHRARTGGALETVLAWRTMALERRFTPCLLEDGDGPVDFSYWPVTQYGGQYTRRRTDGFSALLDAYYTGRDARARMKSSAQATAKTLVTLRDRLRRKLAVQRTEWEAARDRERLREYGDILTAHLHLLAPGMREAALHDFYHGEDVVIPLDPRLSPQQNAARYYKDYRRAKTAEETLVREMEKGRAEADYLDSVLDALDRAEIPAELREIMEELAQGGYIKRRREKNPRKEAPSPPLRFVSSSGVPILAGRNNRQNDFLTMKTAARGDLWLHTQKIPGSHVIVPLGGAEPDDVTLREAAVIAATLSQASASPKVPVDYTRAAHVKKPPGAKPGMVTYERFKTVLAAPDKALVERLRDRANCAK